MDTVYILQKYIRSLDGVSATTTMVGVYPTAFKSKEKAMARKEELNFKSQNYVYLLRGMNLK